MIFQVSNTHYGYIVQAYYDCSWHSLRNFGDYQGNAFEFRDYCCPLLSYTEIDLLAKSFRLDRIYKRVANLNSNNSNELNRYIFQSLK